MVRTAASDRRRRAIISSARRRLTSASSCRSLSIQGSRKLPNSSEHRITPVARKISRSRAGKGVCSFSSSGIDITPASVMAPRTPESAVMLMSRKSNLRLRPLWPRRAEAKRRMRRLIQTHTKRSTISATVMARM